MRTLLKAQMQVEASNKAIMEKKLESVMKEVMERIKPEAAYFLPMDGFRTAIMIFDLKDPTDIPSIAEPFFMNMNAKVDMYPVMNAEDLQKGLGKLKL